MQGYMKKYRSIIFLALFLFLSGNGFAESNADARIRALEETVRSLERRVNTLEGQRSKSPAAPVSSKTSWRKLEKGMSESDVELLLGSPAKVNVYDSFTIWYYGRSFGGLVEFDGETRTVKSWQEP